MPKPVIFFTKSFIRDFFRRDGSHVSGHYDNRKAKAVDTRHADAHSLAHELGKDPKLVEAVKNFAGASGITERDAMMVYAKEILKGTIKLHPDHPAAKHAEALMTPIG